MPDHLSPTEPPRIYATFRYEDAAAMLDWLVKAFGFTVQMRVEDDHGAVAHAELTFGSSMIMLGQARDDDYGRMVGRPGVNGGQSLYLAVDDIDATYKRAKAAGAKIEEEINERPHGSRDFICRDPEGNVWCFGTYWPKAGEEG